MNYNDIDLAINNRIKTFVGLPHSAFCSPNRPLDGEGAFKIPSDGVWVRWTLTYFDTEQTGVGDVPCDRWKGVLTFQIFTPKGEGKNKANDLAYLLGKHFAYYGYIDLEFFAATLKYQGSNETEFQTNLDVRFRVR